MFFNQQIKSYSDALVKLGMYEYVFKPLELPFPNDEANYKQAVDATLDYVYMNSETFEDDFVRMVKNFPEKKYKKSATKWPFWKAAVKYRSCTIENMVSTKSLKASKHVASATSFEDIVPSSILDINNLAYREENLKFLHDLTYRFFHENPAYVTRALVKYMNHTKNAENMYVCNHLYTLVKSHKAGLAINYVINAKPLPEGLCFGKRNVNVRRVLEFFTIKICPWCCKPVNVVAKKKSSAGGAHVSQLFTDDYTQEPLFCVEKNRRGIWEFPLIAFSDRFVANELVWAINKGATRAFTIQASCGGVRMVVIDQKSRQNVYVPVEIKLDDCQNTCLLCVK